MKKIFLSFVFLFAVLFINSCKDDEVVNTDINTSGIPRIKSISEVVTNDDEMNTLSTNIEYSNNKIKKINIKLMDLISEIDYFYNGDKLEKIIYEGDNSGEKSFSEVTLKYQSEKLYQQITYLNGEKIFQADYKYNGNTLIGVSTLDFENGKATDSSYFSEFVDGRPGIHEIFGLNSSSNPWFRQKFKNVYQNGNLIENYQWSATNSRWELENKHYFNTNKENYNKEIFKIIGTSLNTHYPLLTNDFDKNEVIKRETYGLYCDKVKNTEPVLKDVDNFTHNYNADGLLDKINSITTFFCEKNRVYNIETKITWE